MTYILSRVSVKNRHVQQDLDLATTMQQPISWYKLKTILKEKQSNTRAEKKPKNHKFCSIHH